MCKFLILAGGILSFAMAIFHFRLPLLFAWQSDKDKIGLAKSRINYTNNYALMVQFLATGMFSIVYNNELADPSGIAAGICIVISIFWLWRAIWELAYFRMPKGPKPNAPVILHYSLAIISAIICVMYSFPLLFKI